MVLIGGGVFLTYGTPRGFVETACWSSVSPRPLGSVKAVIRTNDGQDDSLSIIRVLVANLPAPRARLVTRLIQQQSDITLVGQVMGQVEVLLATEMDTDILIFGAPRAHPPPGICSHLLAEYPHLRILVLAHSGGTAAMYWLGMQHSNPVHISRHDLLSTIRDLYHLNSTT